MVGPDRAWGNSPDRVWGNGGSDRTHISTNQEVEGGYGNRSTIDDGGDSSECWVLQGSVDDEQLTAVCSACIWMIMCVTS